jgi:cytochrome c-type biogenesis protein CcmH/NrfG
MPDKRNGSSENWTNVQAYTLAVICLLVGVGGGWLFRGSQSPAATTTPGSASAAPPVAMGAGTQPTPEQLKRMADAQAAPMIEKLKSDPNNPDVLASIGNYYYDAQQYQPAIEYYQRALKSRPSDTGIRTDMATAYWYLGNADTAIEEFNKSLAYEPQKPNTLFNLGIVKWQGKMDIDGAVAVWQKLLDTNPHYEARDKVEQLIAQARKHAGVKPGTQAKPLAQ